MTENTLAVKENNAVITANFNTAAGLAIMNQRFDMIQRAAEQLSKCTYLPDSLKGKVDDCAILIELSIGSGIPAFMLAQEIYVVYNRFSFSSKFFIGQIRKRYPTLDFEMSGEVGDMGEVERHQKTDANGKPVVNKYGDPIYEVGKILKQGRTCLAYATEKDGRRVEGVPVSMGMSKAEGWYDKNGSKWPTMPEVMLRYRAAMFFKSFVCPDILFGFKSVEEEHDIVDADVEIQDGEGKGRKPNAFARSRKDAEPEPKKETPTAEAEKPQEETQTPIEQPKAPKAGKSPKTERKPVQEAKAEPEQPEAEVPDAEEPEGEPEAPKDGAKEKPLPKLRRLLSEAGLTEIQCKNYCRRNGMLAGGKVDEFAAERLLNAWETVKGFIAKMPAEEEESK